MPGFENKIWGFRYHDFIRDPCCSRVLGQCVPCLRRRYNDLSFYIGFNHPAVNRSAQATIYSCAAPAVQAAYSILTGACGAAGGPSPACAAAVIAAIPAANNAARTTFRTCMANTDVPESLYRQVNIGIYHRRTTL